MPLRLFSPGERLAFTGWRAYQRLAYGVTYSENEAQRLWELTDHEPWLRAAGQLGVSDAHGIYVAFNGTSNAEFTWGNLISEREHWSGVYDAMLAETRGETDV